MVKIAHGKEGHWDGQDQELGLHLLGTASEATTVLRNAGLVDPYVMELARVSSEIHDLGKAPLVWQKYCSGVYGFWAPHALYSAIAYLGYRILSCQPRRFLGADKSDTVLSDAETGRVVRNLTPVLYLAMQHHAGFKINMDLVQQLLQSFIPFFKGVSATPKDLPRKWVWKSGKEEPGIVLGKGDHFDPLDKGRMFIHEGLVRESMRYAAYTVLPNVSLPDRTSKDVWYLVFALRASIGALKYGDCLNTSSFYGRLRAPRLYLADIATAATARRSELESNTSAKPSVRQLRNAVFDQCSTAPDDSWLYVLGAPTGSGKTLGSLALAGRLGAKQIVFAVPFLAITEQVVEETDRWSLGEKTLAFTSIPPIERLIEREHEGQAASELEPDKVNAQDWVDRKQDMNHPFIVTTTERLSRILTGKNLTECRRMLGIYSHDCVVIIDEAHAIPPYKLHAYLKTLELMACRVILMTATPAAVKAVLNFSGRIGKNVVKPFTYVDVTPAGSLPSVPTLRKFEWTVLPGGPEMTESQVLSIYNTRRQAHDALNRYMLRNPDQIDGVFIITSRLCPKHRWDILQVIRDRLKTGHSCRVFATQTIESGVNLDFPVGYRQIAPYHAIGQVSGRINREGKLPEPGKLVVWAPRNGKSPLRFEAPNWEGPSKEYVKLANKLWARARDKVETDEDLAAIAKACSDDEIRTLGEDLDKYVYTPAEKLRYLPADDENPGLNQLTLIPSSDDYETLVNYDSVFGRFGFFSDSEEDAIEVDMPRDEFHLYTVELPEEQSKLKYVYFRGERKTSSRPTPIRVYSDAYSHLHGVWASEFDDQVESRLSPNSIDEFNLS